MIYMAVATIRDEQGELTRSIDLAVNAADQAAADAIIAQFVKRNKLTTTEFYTLPYDGDASVFDFVGNVDWLGAPTDWKPEPDPGETLTIIVVDGLTCPRCGVGEIDPDTAHLPPSYLVGLGEPHQLLAIRAFKVDMGDGHGWYSECLKCKDKFGNGWFAEDGTLEQAA